MKVYLYSRVSTAEQTLQQQERTAYDWLGSHNLTVDEVISDEGISGGVSYKERNLGKIFGAYNFPYPYYSFLSVGNSYYKMQFNGYNNTLYYRAGSESGLSDKPWRLVAFEDSNVASATKLANTRKIWGQNFNGENDITGDLKIGSANAFGISYSPADTNIYNYFYGGSVLNLKVGEWTASNVNVFDRLASLAAIASVHCCSLMFCNSSKPLGALAPNCSRSCS